MTSSVRLGLGIAFGISALVGCKSDAAGPKEKKTKTDEVTQLAGVWPERFKCDTITSDEALGALLGGTVKQIDNPIQMSRGLAQPCKYEVVDSAGAMSLWSYDFDCRDNFKTTADTLFEQYKQRNDDQIAKWNELSDAGALKPNDAGMSIKPPGVPKEVQVGAKALDHHGNSLLFIDDDAPCYVRVSGLDEEKRLELGKLIAKNLTFMNAPMEPRRPK